MCSSRRILIVEDEALIALDLKTNLALNGFTNVDTAFSPGETLRKCEQSLPDLLLMDINLGGDIDGIETVERIKNGNSHPRVIYITSYNNPKVKMRAQKTVFSDYIIKPYDPSELVGSIKKAFSDEQKYL
ncbi:MAG TPA: response regulator [Spirochaetota bacterium]|nr:response regulator [Spirochaetota bacterium]HOF34779.1 response regulator [Spirochaetota bacterium]HOR45555.1 response regulator [Spirochaetota bacterium]HOU85632.1 response regulator [Spirochaetota bacterium]HPK57138.1 response regulator [Spirochaetota bacterium]